VIALFDLNGTLTDPAGLGEPWGRPEMGVRVLEGAVRSAMCDALTGEFRPFAEHVRASLTVEAARNGLDPGLVDAAAERAARLDPFPDTPAALDLLRGAGVRLAVLSNSGADGAAATLEAAGLADRFERILGVDAVGTFKPDPRTYRHALAELGAEPAEVTMVAAHAWDVTGAKRAGLRGAWIARGEEALSPVAPEPDFIARDLAELAPMLAERA
jgi:2-haloacid dehalogenase